MRLGEDASWADRRPVAVVSYAADAPRPWRWIRDEVRVLDADTLLGMTFTDGPGVRRLGLPFLLRRSCASAVHPRPCAECHPPSEGPFGMLPAGFTAVCPNESFALIWSHG